MKSWLSIKSRLKVVSICSQCLKRILMTMGMMHLEGLVMLSGSKRTSTMSKKLVNCISYWKLVTRKLVSWIHGSNEEIWLFRRSLKIKWNLKRIYKAWLLSIEIKWKNSKHTKRTFAQYRIATGKPKMTTKRNLMSASV